MRYVVLVLSLVLAAGVGGCDRTQAQAAQPEVPAAAAPGEALVAGNNDFAVRLYQQLRGRGGNLFYSPYSISTALAMTYAGARGETERQMARTLGFSLPQQELHPAFRALAEDLAARGKEMEGFRLHLANALWGQQGHPFLPGFVDLLARDYGAGLKLVDFTRDPEGARRTINQWAEKETENKIKDLVPPGLINPLTRLVLANAIYFDAKWLSPFAKDGTRPAPFTLASGQKVDVETMHETLPAGYAEEGGWQVVELPYRDRNMAMDVLLPSSGALREADQSLDAARLASLLGRLKRQSVALSLPQFTYESSFNLNDALSAMGMPDAFDRDRADFSGMDGKRDLLIGFVVHKALVRVDEEGTEAAAATAVGMQLKAAPAAPRVVEVDRPFLFLVRDTKTGTMLFVGRVMDPRGTGAK
jgi:serpin B